MRDRNDMKNMLKHGLLLVISCGTRRGGNSNRGRGRQLAVLQIRRWQDDHCELLVNGWPRSSWSRYGEVWRAGVDDATSFCPTVVEVGDVPAGRYTIFIRPAAAKVDLYHHSRLGVNWEFRIQASTIRARGK